MSVCRASLEYCSEPIVTGIYKEPISSRVKVGNFYLEGDAQADLCDHGGYSKAVYVYPSEHYEFWRNELPGMELPFRIFGKNLTTERLLEAEVNVGDRFRVGTTEFVVTPPRVPCFKLSIRFNRTDIIK